MAPVKPKKKSLAGSSTKLTSGIKRVKGENFYRDAKKAARVKMLTGGKPIRDKMGKIIQTAAFQAGEDKAGSGRVQPDRRWFGEEIQVKLGIELKNTPLGNTRVISQDALEHFRTSLSTKKNDPYSVLLRRNKLPMSLLDDTGVGQKRSHIVDTEPFQETFGPKAQRKKPRLEVGTFEDLQKACEVAGDEHRELEDAQLMAGVLASETAVAAEGGYLGSSFAMTPAAGPSKPRGWTAHGGMSAINKAYAPVSEPIFKKGTSRRIYGELYKVIDSSDVIIHVLDARDPLGTLCTSVIDYVRKEKSHKQVVYLINKVDLVPGWVTQRYITHLTPQAPTLGFHASQTHSFGKGALIQLLRQFSQLHSDRKQISVGFVGYPNVGKSSVINCLKQGKVCNVAPIPGETKVWQYITLMRRIYLIDCPGIVPASANDSQTSKVLKGVVRVEHLAFPSEHIPELLSRVRPIYLERTYNLEGLMEKSLHLTAAREDAPSDTLSAGKWNADAFLDAIARKSGRLLKGGEPDRETVAKMVLNDWIRGNIPYFVKPPDSGTFLAAGPKAAEGDVILKQKIPKVVLQDADIDMAINPAPSTVWASGEEVIPVRKHGDEDGLEDNQDEASANQDDDSNFGTNDENAPMASVARQPRTLYVQQDVRGIISRTKFVKDDRFDAEVPLSANVVEDMLAVDVMGIGSGADGDAFDGNADSGAEDDGDEDEGEEDPTSLCTSPLMSEKARGKQKEYEGDDADGVAEGKYKKIAKDPRMSTNKRKPSNFFTHANVKNRNRDKKLALPNVGGNDRGRHGNMKGTSLGRKKK